MDIASFLAIVGASGPLRRSLFKINRKDRPKAKLIRIERITAGGHHAWCESNVGLIKKPLASVPDDLIAEFRRRAV
jgi:hypothetical protein